MHLHAAVGRPAAWGNSHESAELRYSQGDRPGRRRPGFESARGFATLRNARGRALLLQGIVNKAA